MIRMIKINWTSDYNILTNYQKHVQTHLHTHENEIADQTAKEAITEQTIIATYPRTYGHDFKNKNKDYPCNHVEMPVNKYYDPEK